MDSYISEVPVDPEKEENNWITPLLIDHVAEDDPDPENV